MNKTTLSILLEKFSYLSKRESLDYPAVNVPHTYLHELCFFVRDEMGFVHLADLTAVDWGVDSEPRFTTVYHFYNPDNHSYLRVACDCDSAEKPSVPSLVDLWPAANWHEREAFDMFGICFLGHPDLRRILMWDDYAYYPLRKDFPLAGIDTEIPSEEVQEQTSARVIAAPMAGGPFCPKTTTTMRQNEPSGADQSWSEKAPKPSH
ncbi:MAG: NADH-quinone oxidoreductase subunit C [Verrucomicrobia bacterium CG_4_10_14_3_um_filter_43_23]|nr:MAG: hypothetical protein AUJ82_08560 [Verrucomicrobia bacterium CG1_02_43_26]PIP58533.1 MAG: NADH-quinone oxidoreductase subunit C [Verrucomicrobia bacterium CG22_combo_CG10-13_8_21_14_all_43_17]PIX58331.1 MAG: NADH-quinone oxidoreductase subunit C [Verrucomicrobia bacterium CG_4_10_14_3_um_filter_43_23]PIY60858.1 MAG: NADH-quinone oxidoreductase subunit C [Verrucomicrobia bacterium CG_4_10_14_0_8_um_filter_43_34]PJA44348.1 MAG: NADH-quinone oxidoreductase subunit C [Verrucomicrobia bacteri